jgi:hypothetical protein
MTGFAGLIVVALFTVILVLARAFNKDTKWNWWWCAMLAGMYVAMILINLLTSWIFKV